VHLALGTAMASIIFTSSASVRAHHGRGAVDWSIVRRLAPGMALGALLATFASGFVSQRVLALAFAAIVYAGATQMLLGGRPSASRGLPGTAGMLAVGAAIGVICGLVSAGGRSSPCLSCCSAACPRSPRSAPRRRSASRSRSSHGGLRRRGWRVPGLPAATLGFVFLPALAALVAGSVATAPLGARLAHRLPLTVLKRIFALLLSHWPPRWCWRTSSRRPGGCRRAAAPQQAACSTDQLQSPQSR